MRKFAILVMCMLGAMTAFAQAPLAKGKVQLNAGVGLSGWGFPVYAGVDIGIHKDITLGAELSFRYYNPSYYRSSTITGILINGNYHFNRLLKMPEKFDFYAGANIGFYLEHAYYRSWYNGRENYSENYSAFVTGAQVGGRYFFNQKFGLNAELNASNTFVTYGGGIFGGGKFGITYIF